MKLTKQLVALALALLMFASAPIAALADDPDPNFTLNANASNFYAGISYDIEAKITDASASDAANAQFTWSIATSAGTDNARIANSSAYSSNDNGNGTYTVSQKATFSVTEPGVTAQITATLGSRSKTFTITSIKKPIETFKVNFENSDTAYFDEASNTLYVDSKKSDTGTESARFTISDVSPEENDDSITIGFSAFDLTKVFCVSEGASSNAYNLSFAQGVTTKGSINFVTKSGKTSRKYNVQACVAATRCALSCTAYDGTTASNYVTSQSNSDVQGTLQAVQGKTFKVSASGDLGNDSIKYELYTDEELTHKAPDTYYTTSGNTCELTIATPNTYYLVSKNYSKDNGKLSRTLGRTITEIIVAAAKPIQSIELFKLDDEGNQTAEALSEITLYTNADSAHSTYALDSSVVCTPNKDETTGDSYSFSVDDSQIATVNSTTGLITAVKKGTTTVWVKSKDNSKAVTSLTVNVKIGVKSITDIVKSDNSVVIPSGHVQSLSLTTNPTVVDDSFYWFSQNEDVLSVDPSTGVLTAKEVTDNTEVEIRATADSGASKAKTFTVVPANKAQSLELTATTTSESMTVDTSGAYKKYTDYYVSGSSSRKPFVITADAPGANGEQTNDELIWSITYEDGIGLTFDEAVTEGLISYTKQLDSMYSVTPLKQGEYRVSCIAVTNVTAPTPNDASDTIIIKILQNASSISVRDTNTGNNTEGTIYLPIGSSKQITVKTSTSDNDKKVDPPVYKITQGAEYVNVTQKASSDGEGITYTIKGVSYGKTATKIRFSSKSGSQYKDIVFYVRNNLNSAEIRGLSASYVYTGSEIRPAVTVFFSGSSIDSNLYSVSYSDNVNVGTATVTISGLYGTDYYGSSKKVTFKITAKPFDSTIVIGDIGTQYLTSDVRKVTPAPSVYYNNRWLTKDVDYTLSYKNNTVAGTGTVTITGKGNYSGTTSRTFKINDVASKFKIDAISDKTYSASEIKPKPVVKYNGKTLKFGTDYTLSYASNVNVGTATVYVTGIGDYYRDSTSKTFKIVRRKLDKNITIAKIANQYLNGDVREALPSPEVKYKGNVIWRDVDYKVSYKKNKKAGTATFIITGIGNFKGTATRKFKVIDDAAFFSISKTKNKTYTGKKLTQKITVKYKGKKLKKNKDYKIKYENNVNPGTATVTITGKGFYAGTRTLYFTIKPKQQKISKLGKGEGKFTVKWAKHKGVSGYEVQYCRSKKFKDEVGGFTVDPNSNTATAEYLGTKTTYYVRIRSYVYTNDTTLYGAWSKVKSVKTK